MRQPDGSQEWWLTLHTTMPFVTLWPWSLIRRTISKTMSELPANPNVTSWISAPGQQGLRKQLLPSMRMDKVVPLKYLLTKIGPSSAWMRVDKEQPPLAYVYMEHDQDRENVDVNVCCAIREQDVFVDWVNSRCAQYGIPVLNQSEKLVGVSVQRGILAAFVRPDKVLVGLPGVGWVQSCQTWQGEAHLRQALFGVPPSRLAQNEGIDILRYGFPDRWTQDTAADVALMEMARKDIWSR